MWQCPRCGTTNHVSSPACVVCGTAQPAPPEPTTVPVSVPPQQYPSQQYPSQQWSYDPYGQPAQQPPPPPPPPPSSDGRRAVILAACIVVTVVLAIVAVVVIRAVSNKPGTPTGSATVTPPATGTTPPPTGSTPTPTPAPTIPSPPPTVPPSTAPVVPTTIGIVNVQPVATDPATPDVGQLFNAYFSGINGKNYPQALAVFDPAGSLDTNDSHQVASFEHGISTTTDSQVVLRSIVPDTTGDGVLDARVTFESHQHAGFGPSAHPNETCTRWDITYVLSQSGTSYLIFKASRFSNSGC